MAFEDLDVWKRASTLSADIYIEMQKIRDYGFRDQITRSGLSVPSNIAEGVDRSSAKETMNFLSYAKGSCAELRTQILIGMKIGYISKDIGINWANETREISAMLVGLSKTIKNQ
ncbi:four helix bundle protein [Thiohalophilus sp.]|uniref:four helix bundle protein n=1 Tax=Thiohalophilus sp. TaxID=3028392 RepID=UPI002ACEAB74|nr:four helix bundle protein [Thiohalophilus sp.]MDZ7804374.1 four helix bundle protein [Thiohalophilus sp.]